MKIIIALDSIEIPAWKFNLLKKIKSSSSSEIILFCLLKDSKRARYTSATDEEALEAFKLELKKLILEICNPKIDFIEKEV